MKRITLFIILLCVTLVYSDTTLEEKLKIYIDYPDGDLNFFREEISNVDFVRFMQEAKDKNIQSILPVRNVSRESTNR